MGKEILYDNDSAWSADHCADVSQVPGILFCNKAILKKDPALIDVAPTILGEFGLQTPASIKGRTIFG
jgi:bisphosphoglycerate-independent phosphoglycerate mutase (AlkP superfamily)